MKLQITKQIIMRDIRKQFSHFSRQFGFLLRPLLWFFIVGSGFNALNIKLENITYQQYLAPGIVAMVALFSGVMLVITQLRDRDNGLIRLLLIAPLSRTEVLCARLCATLIVTIIHCSVILIILMLNLKLSIDIPLLLTGLMIIVFCVCLGSVIETFTKEIENFAFVVNFILFPLYFLSGALYPYQVLPRWIQFISQLNPFTYAMDLLHHSFHAHLFTIASIQFDIFVLASVTLLMLLLSLYRFNQLEVSA